MRQSINLRLLALTLATALIFFAPGCGGGGGGGDVRYVPVPSDRPAPKGDIDPDIAADPLFDLSGTWIVDSTNSLNSCGEIPEDTEFDLEVTHNVATGKISGTHDGVAFTGEYRDGIVEFDVPYTFREDDEDDGAEAWTTMTQVTIYVVGEDGLSAVSTWEWDRVDDDKWDCEGLDYWIGRRVD